ncbi:CCAMK, partial [Symbiodinium microadriaticum]
RKFFDPADPYPVIVMEALLGESLLYRIITHRDISEQVLVDLFKSFVKALLSIHQRGLVHRDIKLDNIMLQTLDASSDMKIVDFGMMVEVGENGIYTDTHLAGTPGFYAPESSARREYSVKSDVWQSGIVLFIMLTGRAPFQAGDNEAIRHGAFATGEFFEACPVMAKDLIRRMLTVDTEQRIDLEDVLTHPWITEAASSGERRPIANSSSDGSLPQTHTAEANWLPTDDLEDQLLALKKKVIRQMFPLVEKIQPVQDEEMNGSFAVRLHLMPSILDYDTFAKIATEADLDVLLVPGLFNVFDRDGSGNIDVKEFLLTILTLRHSETALTETDPAQLYFSLFDLDGDGVLSYEEFKWMLVCLMHDTSTDSMENTPLSPGIPRKLVDEAFQCMDDNRDMHVDIDEFKRFYHSLIYSNIYSDSDAEGQGSLAFESGGESMFSSTGSSILISPSRQHSSIYSFPSGSPSREPPLISAMKRRGVLRRLQLSSDEVQDDDNGAGEDADEGGGGAGDNETQMDCQEGGGMSNKKTCTIQ